MANRIVRRPAPVTKLPKPGVPMPSVEETPVTLKGANARAFNGAVEARDKDIAALQAQANVVTTKCALAALEEINDSLSEDLKIEGDFRWNVKKRHKDGSLDLVIQHAPRPKSKPTEDKKD